MTFDAFLQRVLTVDAMFEQNKVAHDQYLRYIARLISQVAPHLAIDPSQVNLTSGNSAMFPGIRNRILKAIQMHKALKISCDDLLMYLASQLKRLQVVLREGPRQQRERQDDDRVGLDPDEDPDAYRVLDSLDPEELGAMAGSFTEDDARRLYAPDEFDAPDDFSEPGADL